MSKDYFALDTNSMKWDLLEVADINATLPLKTCVVDSETGVSIWKIQYKAGFTNISHWHNCSHGIYVLDGVLRTHAGEYGPGSFVWFPEGMTQSHGATEDNDVTFLFVTNKAFDIHYTHLVGERP
ncbi:DUF4437 domain-containing protein [Agrobacterium vitis]|uniref:DUF4437 domain-containing protein n=1 Tax=Agrobacterium vitis TaxID=373 RepID=A0A6L6VIF6_AGRVI|nr:DUF4437 domain-containing protein [Agrobacterium vitis]MUZ75613.1 DUF4437 domain-containing protein [Agrobacterium vitis]